MWPLEVASKPELKLWASLWRMPQAAAWEQQGSARTVARYVRTVLRAERPEAPVMLMPAVSQLEDKLGLTPLAMLRLRWVVSADEVGEQRVTAPAAPSEVRRPRLRAIDPAMAVGE